MYIYKQACYTGIRIVGTEAKYVFGCANKQVSMSMSLYDFDCKLQENAFV